MTFPNETMRLLNERGSCRAFVDDPIPPDVLRQVIEAGLHAPTGGNLQPYSIIQIERTETRQWLRERCGQGFIENAPASLLFCLDFRRLKRWAELRDAPFTATRSFRHFWISFQDTLICAQNICTAADVMGLGSVYIGTVLEFFDELRDRLALPDGVFPVVLLCLGYPRTAPKVQPKLGIDIVVHVEQYRDLSDQDLLAAFEAKYSSRRVESTEERLEALAETCRAVSGDDLAARAVGTARRDGYINAAQRYFGLHYRASEMPKGNARYLAQMEASGFKWFTPYEGDE
ncbi:MAG: nitroreductase family protein [Anaerolineae bacterium]|nr:nitroreductase family protein [Anaerolineae bacterium]